MLIILPSSTPGSRAANTPQRAGPTSSDAFTPSWRRTLLAAAHSNQRQSTQTPQKPGPRAPPTTSLSQRTPTSHGVRTLGSSSPRSRLVHSPVCGGIRRSRGFV
ncbi:hypothetical protein C8Q80DRAFT_521636 [Daedaleopsis nitida]|nr:hypothetical protein C8Q80DRAFT_521636 [Daedaleopsis nitida]